MAIVEGKTKGGFKYSVDDRIADNWELVEAITDCESTDASIQLRGIRSLVNLVFGAAEGARLKEFCAKKNDGIPSTKMMTEITAEVLQSINATKN